MPPSLPPEIRDMIWGYVIDSNNSVEMRTNISDKYRRFCVLPWAGIIAANRTFQDEISAKLSGKRRLVRVGGGPLRKVIKEFTSSALCKKLVKSLSIDVINFAEKHAMLADFTARQIRQSQEMKDTTIKMRLHDTYCPESNWAPMVLTTRIEFIFK